VANPDSRTDADRLEAILTAAPDGILVVDEEGRITLASEQAQRMFGYSADELIGQPVEKLVPVRYRGTHVADREAYTRAARRRPMGAGKDLVAVTRDGREIPVEISLSPVTTVHGTQVVAIVRDVTDRRRLQQELERRNDELLQADRKKDEFLAVLAHELRNPLAPIQSAMEVLHQPDAAGEDLAWARDVVSRQVTQLARLVDDLLDVARISRGKIRLQREAVRLDDVLDGAIETSRPGIHARRQVLEVVREGSRVELVGDRVRLSQVVANLLSNASKYSEEGRRIWLSAVVHDGTVEIRVRDEGLGIPAEFVPRLFESFAQADRSLDRSHGGLGIGLMLVKSLVELHAGTVAAHSDGAGRGSEFVVRLPLGARSGAGAATAAPAPAPSASSPHRRILLADDNVDFAHGCARLLRRRGHEVQVVADGPSAIDAARDWKPDVVLLDIGLPGMDGYAVAAELRRTPGLEASVIIAISGYGRDEDRVRSRDAGFDAHLTKPVSIAVLEPLLVLPRGTPVT
jgi:PAS domain S-box-containing protein